MLVMLDSAKNQHQEGLIVPQEDAGISSNTANPLDIVSLLLGAAIAFISALAIQFVQRHWTKRDRIRRIKRLARLLYEEIEQAAEIIAIDLDLNGQFLLTGDEIEQKLSLVGRLERCNVVFHAHTNELLDLPDTIPNALSRFHGRLAVLCARMEKALTAELHKTKKVPIVGAMSTASTSDPIVVYNQIREQLALEAEVLKTNLKSTF